MAWIEYPHYQDDDTNVDDDNDKVVRCWQGSSSSSLPHPHFLWENAPRHESKAWRDRVRCYSHLPNGTAILDSKWVLGRLLSSGSALSDPKVVKTTQSEDETTSSRSSSSSTRRTEDPHLAVLPTLCFRGPDEFLNVARRLGLVSRNNDDTTVPQHHQLECELRDLVLPPTTTPKKDDDANATTPSTATDVASSSSIPAPTPNLWVIKDAHANGAGGIWMVGPDTHDASSSVEQTRAALTNGHWYVAQQYAWPPVLYQSRKCHVRVYALLTADGRAYVHRQCFVHVANDPFVLDGTIFPDSVHITNCCANSHDLDKFAGEIVADLKQRERQAQPATTSTATTSFPDANEVLGLADFAPSIYASVAALTRSAFPFLRGGEANGGFEYLGLDFILSHKTVSKDNSDEYDDDDKITGSTKEIPVAYLLEVNAPPSQDTATGLPHAEKVHDTVLRDLLTLWVYPRVMKIEPVPGGWHCVFGDTTLTSNDINDTDMILPSKAAILNRIRWTLYERKILAAEQESNKMRNHDAGSGNAYEGKAPYSQIAHFARISFPYYTNQPKSSCGESTGSSTRIYFENAGGTQVPSSVIQEMTLSLECRHRAHIGAHSVASARATIALLLGASPSAYTLFLGQNASSILATLAHQYVKAGLLRHGDEVLISSDNHLANVEPWIQAAQTVGAIIKWWDPVLYGDSKASAPLLVDLLSAKTRIVVVPHASNVVGQYNDDLNSLRSLVDKATNGNGHIVVDGVAAVPHRYADVDTLAVDWYVVSCHKMFGPHLGVLCGRKTVVNLFSTHDLNDGGNHDEMDSHNKGVYAYGFEMGTMNFEACQGVHGLGQYFINLSAFSTSAKDFSSTTEPSLPNNVSLERRHVVEAYRLIELAETPMVHALLEGLRRSRKVHIIHGSSASSSRLPVVCFVHSDLSNMAIEQHCRQGGVTCRQGTFLSTRNFRANVFAKMALLSHSREVVTKNVDEGFVRFSLAHYNTVEDVHTALAVLESMPHWF